MIIRRATSGDALDIHKTHVKSIQEVCSDSYTTEQIKAWSREQFNKTQRIKNIEDDLIWVILESDNIVGHAHIIEYKDRRFCELRCLYIVKEFIGKGLGTKMTDYIKKEVSSLGYSLIKFHSTLNAVDFYKSCGAIQTSDTKMIKIRGVEMPAIPMEFAL